MMKQDREFDNILDDCLERLLVGGESLEQCLQRYPQQADELKPLLETALAAREASFVQPRPEFRARARYQFRAALQEKAAPKRRSFFGWVPQWATALAIVLVLLLAGGGTVAAASDSMPDSFLYPVKLATEEVQLALTTSQLDKARLCASFADQRVLEIVYMAEQGDAEQIELITERLGERLEMLADYSSALEAGKAVTMLSTTDSAPADTATSEESAAAADGEESMVTSADDAQLPVEEDAQSESVGGWGRDGGGNGQGGGGNQTKLHLAVAGSAATNPALLREMLANASPSVRAALQHAIAVSEAGYEDILEALGY